MDKILHKLAGPAGLLLGIVLSQSAAGQVDVSLTASAPRAALTDLTPDDGLAPGLRWLSYRRHMDGMVLTERDDIPLYTRLAEAPDDGPAQLAFDWNGLTGVGMDILPDGGGLSGARVTAFAGRGGLAEHYALANTWLIHDFELAPHTMARFSVDYTLALFAQRPRYGWDGGSVLGSLFGGFEDLNIGSFGFESLLEYVGPNSPGYGVAVDKDLALSIFLVNDTDAWAIGHVGVDMSALAQNMPGPVPEAPAWAMFVGGLLACAARRRKASADYKVSKA